MLVLSRRVGERIAIGDGIEVTILESNGRQVRLGIEAPATVAVFREELVVRRAHDEAGPGPATGRHGPAPRGGARTAALAPAGAPRGNS